MFIGVICAMSEELDIILSSMKDINTKNIAGINFHIGLLHSKKIITCISGIGKVNAALCSQILISEFKASHIINIGVAGSTKEDISPSDVVIGDELLEHDFDTTAFGMDHGVIPRMDVSIFPSDKNLVLLAKKACALTDINYHTGRIVSGDQFISNKEKVLWLENTFDSLACEMEGASIAHTCYLNNVPFLVVRSISDNAITKAHMEYNKFKPIAIKNSSKILNYIIESLN